MNLADVLAVIAGVMAACVSLWALLMGAALLWPERAQAARERVEQNPWRSLGIGAVLAFTAGLIGAGMMANPNGLVKLIGYILSMGLLAMMTVGAGGMAMLVGERIRRYEPYLSGYGATGRGAGLIVGAALVPLFGWFAVAPFVSLVSLGAGFQAFAARAREKKPVAPNNVEAVS